MVTKKLYWNTLLSASLVRQTCCPVLTWGFPFTYPSPRLYLFIYLFITFFDIFSSEEERDTRNIQKLWQLGKQMCQLIVEICPMGLKKKTDK